MSNLLIDGFGVGCLFACWPFGCPAARPYGGVPFRPFTVMFQPATALGCDVRMPSPDRAGADTIPMFSVYGLIAAQYRALTRGAFDSGCAFCGAGAGRCWHRRASVLWPFAAPLGRPSRTTAAIRKNASRRCCGQTNHPSLATGVVAGVWHAWFAHPPSILMCFYGILHRAIDRPAVYRQVLFPACYQRFVYMAMITVRAKVTPALAPPVVSGIDRKKNCCACLWSVLALPWLVWRFGRYFGGFFQRLRGGAVGAFLALQPSRCCVRSLTRKSTGRGDPVQTTLRRLRSSFCPSGAVMFSTPFHGAVRWCQGAEPT